MTEAANETGAGHPERPDALVSYSRRDKEFAEKRLAAALAERGKDVWIDVDDIRGGASDWWADVSAGIEAAKALVFVVTPHSLRSSVCQKELAHAAALNKRVIPVVQGDVDAGALPDALARPNWVRVPAGDGFEAGVDALVDALELDEDWIETHARLTQRTAEWLRERRDHSYLLRGRDLRAAERWLDERAEHAESPTPEQVAYIGASRRAAARRLAMLLLGVAVALGASITLGILAYLQRQSARSQASAARAVDAVRRDPEQGLRLALEAAELGDSALVERALREALAASGWTRILRAEPASPLNDVALSPDGRLAVSAHEDGIASVWELRGGRRLASLRHDGAINGVEFSRDGRRIATAASDGTARIWTPAGRRLRVLRPGPPEVWSAAFAPRGERLLTQTGGGTAQVWDLTRRTAPLRLPGGAEDRLALAPFSPDGRRLLTGGPAASVRVWTLASRPRATRLRPPASTGALFATVASFDRAGRRVLAGYDSGHVCLWRLRRPRVAASCRAPGRSGAVAFPVTDVDFSRDGRHYLSAGADGRAVLRATRDGRPVATLRHGGPLNAASFNPAGDLLVTASEDREARVWTRSGRLERVLGGHTDAVVAARFSRDGRRVVTGSRDGSARVWATRAGVTTLPGAPLPDADVAFGPDGSRLLAVARDGRAVVWNLRGRARVELRPAMAPGETGLSPCLRYVGCAPWDADGLSVAGAAASYTATRWDARTGAGRELAPGFATGAALSPDGRRVVVFRELAAVRVLAADSGERIGAVRGGVLSVSFADDGSPMMSATEDGRRVGLWDARLRALPVGRAAAKPGRLVAAGPQAAALAADGTRLAIATPDGALQLHELASGERRSVPTRHGGDVTAVAFDRAGEQLVTLGDDRTMRVFEADALGEPVAVLRGHDQRLLDAEFSPDGRFLLSASVDGSARLWDPALETSVLVFRKGGNGGARFSPDGRLIAIGGARTVELHRCEVCAPFAQLVRLARARLPGD